MSLESPLPSSQQCLPPPPGAPSPSPPLSPPQRRSSVRASTQLARLGLPSPPGSPSPSPPCSTQARATRWLVRANRASRSLVCLLLTLHRRCAFPAALHLERALHPRLRHCTPRGLCNRTCGSAPREGSAPAPAALHPGGLCIRALGRVEHRARWFCCQWLLVTRYAARYEWGKTQGSLAPAGPERERLPGHLG